jgi:hypothetical protein
MKFSLAIFAAGVASAAAEHSYSYSYEDFCPEAKPTECLEAGVWVACECMAQMEADGEIETCDGRCKAAIDNLNDVCKKDSDFFDPDLGEVSTYDPIAFELFVKEGVPACEGEVKAPPTLILKVQTTAPMTLEKPTAEQQADEEFMYQYATGVEKGIHKALKDSLSTYGAFEIELKSVGDVVFNEPGARRLAEDEEVDVVFDVVMLVVCDGDCDEYAAKPEVAETLTDNLKAAVQGVDKAALGASIVEELQEEDIEVDAVVVGNPTVGNVEVEVNEPVDAPTPASTNAPTVDEEVDGGASAVAAGASAVAAVAVAAVALF